MTIKQEELLTLSNHKDLNTFAKEGGFDENGIHKDTGNKYNPQGYTKYDFSGRSGRANDFFKAVLGEIVLEKIAEKQPVFSKTQEDLFQKTWGIPLKTAPKMCIIASDDFADLGDSIGKLEYNNWSRTFWYVPLVGFNYFLNFTTRKFPNYVQNVLELPKLKGNYIP